MPEICVIGLGYVGLPTASLLATAGFKVLGVDVNPRTVQELNAGRTHHREADLSTLVAAAHDGGNLVAALEPVAADTFIICVPTRVNQDHDVDISQVAKAGRMIAPVLRPGCLVVLESTSPVGTTRNVVGAAIRKAGHEPGKDVHLCYCTERVLPDNTVAEMVTNDRVVGGFTPACAERARAIYARFCKGAITLTDDLTAELSKLMENTFRDVNIALANVFARVAEDAGIDVWQAIRCANRHPRVKILSPGSGAGGHSIPVDPWFLAGAFPKHTALLRDAREINDTQGARALKRLLATGLIKRGDKLAVLGAAYKADIAYARESPALRLVQAAKDAGLKTAVHDPLVGAGIHEGLEVSGDLDACLAGAAAAILMTNHTAYRELEASQWAERMPGRLFCDTRHCLDHEGLEAAGFTVVVLGDGKQDGGIGKRGRRRSRRI